MRCVLCILGSLLLWVGGAVFLVAFTFAGFFEIVPASWSFGGYVLMFLGCMALAGVPWSASLLLARRYC